VRGLSFAAAETLVAHALFFCLTILPMAAGLVRRSVDSWGVMADAGKYTPTLGVLQFSNRRVPQKPLGRPLLHYSVARAWRKIVEG
jgi:hypothetical protein